MARPSTAAHRIAIGEGAGRQLGEKHGEGGNGQVPKGRHEFVSRDPRTADLPRLRPTVGTNNGIDGEEQEYPDDKKDGAGCRPGEKILIEGDHGRTIEASPRT